MDFSLYLITDRSATNGRPLTEVVRKALEGGVRAVQLREKDLPDRDLYDLALQLRAVTSHYHARLLINSRVDIALAASADGVHLGSSTLPIAAARNLLGPDRLIGYSAHSVDDVRQAAAAGADFATFGPVYDTPSKRAYGPPAGLERLKEAAHSSALPLFALGGVTVARIPEILASGCHRIALISSIMSAPDPKLATQSLQQALDYHVAS